MRGTPGRWGAPASCVVIALVFAFGASGSRSAAPGLATNGKIAFSGERDEARVIPLKRTGPPPPPPPPMWAIYTMNPDGTDVRRITSRDRNYDPNWAPDGSKIAFDSWRDGGAYDFEIYTMNPDGSAVVNLTNNTDAIDTQADWSPDGTKIVWTSTLDGTYHLWVMNADGSDQHRLTTNPQLEGAAAWS